MELGSEVPGCLSAVVRRGEGRDRHEPPPQGVSLLNHTKSRAPAHVHGARSPQPQETQMLHHTRGRAPAQVHGASSPLPRRRQVCSATVGAGCAPPVPQKPRSLRAYHAVASPAVYTRSLDARSPPAIRAQKRVSPHGTLGSTGGRPLPAGEGRDRNRPPPQGVSLLNHTRGSAPEHVHGARPPSLQTLFFFRLFFFRVCSWFPSVASCPTPGAGLRLWSGSTPPGVRLCAHLLPFLWGGAFPRPRPRARRGLTLPRAYVVEGLRASRDRV